MRGYRRRRRRAAGLATLALGLLDDLNGRNEIVLFIRRHGHEAQNLMFDHTARAAARATRATRGAGGAGSTARSTGRTGRAARDAGRAARGASRIDLSKLFGPKSLGGAALENVFALLQGFLGVGARYPGNPAFGDRPAGVEW